MLKKLICKIFGHKPRTKIAAIDAFYEIKIVKYCERCKKMMEGKYESKMF